MFRKILPLCLSIFLLAACNNNAEPAKSETPSDSTGSSEEVVAGMQLNMHFPELQQYFQSQDSTFHSAGFHESELVEKDDSSDLPLDTALLRKYKPYLLFNDDSTLALDMVSYNFYPEVKNGKMKMQEIGPDFEVSMLYLKPKKQKRLLFFGSSGGSVLDAKWLDHSTVLIAGAIDWENGDSLRPVVWRFDAAEKTWQEFRYPEMIKAAWHNYPKKITELNRP